MTSQTKMAARKIGVGLLGNKTTAVLLCDMQDKFRPTIRYFPQIVSVSNRILKAAMALDVPVIVTEQYPQGLGPTVPELGIEEFNLKPVAKTQFCMLVPEVDNLLKSASKYLKSIVICGIEAHVCVQQSALGFLEAGYDVHIVVDAVSSRTMTDRKFAFERMKACGAYLTTSESLIFSLLRDANHPKFKDVLKFVKESPPDTGLLEI